MVLFELDVPGHAAAWAAGNPALVVSCDGGQTLINPVPAGAVPGAPSPGADLYAVLEVCPPGLELRFVASHSLRLRCARLSPSSTQAARVAERSRGSTSEATRSPTTCAGTRTGPVRCRPDSQTLPCRVQACALCLSPMQYGPGLHRWAARRLPMPLRAPAPKWHVACRPFCPRTASAPCSGRRRCTTASRPRPLWRRGSQVRRNTSGCCPVLSQLPSSRCCRLCRCRGCGAWPPGEGPLPPQKVSASETCMLRPSPLCRY